MESIQSAINSAIGTTASLTQSLARDRQLVNQDKQIKAERAAREAEKHEAEMSVLKSQEEVRQKELEYKASPEYQAKERAAFLENQEKIAHAEYESEQAQAKVNAIDLQRDIRQGAKPWSVNKALKIPAYRDIMTESGFKSKAAMKRYLRSEEGGPAVAFQKLMLENAERKYQAARSENYAMSAKMLEPESIKARNNAGMSGMAGFLADTEDAVTSEDWEMTNEMSKKMADKVYMNINKGGK